VIAYAPVAIDRIVFSLYKLTKAAKTGIPNDATAPPAAAKIIGAAA